MGFVSAMKGVGKAANNQISLDKWLNGEPRKLPSVMDITSNRHEAFINAVKSMEGVVNEEGFNAAVDELLNSSLTEEVNEEAARYRAIAGSDKALNEKITKRIPVVLDHYKSLRRSIDLCATKWSNHGVINIAKEKSKAKVSDAEVEIAIEAAQA
jgi:hypothetical protein